MSPQRYLDSIKFNHALRENGFTNANEFATRSGIHRNSISQYLNRDRGVFTGVFLRICESLKVSDPSSLISFEGERSGRLNEDKLRSVLEHLTDLDPELAFILIGSRASGKFRENSDWDVGVSMGAKGVNTELYLTLKTKFEDLTEDFAESCDLVNLDAAPLWFLQGLQYVPKFLNGARDTYLFFIGMLSGIRKAEKNQEGSRAA